MWSVSPLRPCVRSPWGTNPVAHAIRFGRGDGREVLRGDAMNRLSPYAPRRLGWAASRCAT
eukprot:4157661-Pyramimonas_sp.AAC.1